MTDPKSGFYLIDKPQDWTSFDVCAKMRKKLNTKKIGHTGTLDPFATGLLVVAVGKGTRLIPYVNSAKKTYVTTIKLGATTPSLDPESLAEETITHTGPAPTEADVAAAVATFVGQGTQVPPVFSAVKINGKRAYKLARKGTDVQMPPREIHVHSAKLLEYIWPHATIELTAAAGFYVRSFARDLGEKLGLGGGYCTALRRTAVADLCVEDAETLETLTSPIDPKYIVDALPHREITAERLNDFWAGRAFPYVGTNGEKYLVLCNGTTVGVGEMVHDKLQPRAVL